MTKVLFRNIKELHGVEFEGNRKPVYSGKEMREMASIKDAFLLLEGTEIHSFGKMSACPELSCETRDLQGKKMILPGFCDSHTHIVFHSSREGEFVDRIKGLSYEEISQKGGGILNSALALQSASEDELYQQASRRLEEVIAMGTTAIEIKSGYGLTLDSEIKMLRVTRRLQENYPLDIKSTFLGAHAIPGEFKSNRDKYIKLIVNEMLPAITKEGLADYIDVFCDQGFFTVEETDRILKAGNKYGLKAKIHANELAVSGGVQVGVKNNALSVDHLEKSGSEEINCLLGSDTMPCALPSTSFFLNLPYAPVRKMIDAGLAVTLASDYNPGSTPSGKMPFVMSLACIKQNLLPKEALTALTINGAHAMELSDSQGSIAIGKHANFILSKEIPSLAYIPYSFGGDHIDSVYIKGKKQ